MIGIYKITNKLNGKVYIGQSNNIERRFKEHINKRTTAWSSIRPAILKYGVENFSFEVLEECSIEELNKREEYWIKYYGSFGEKGYNLNPGGDQSSLGQHNGRALLKDEDVILIRKAYQNRSRRKDVYEQFKDRITFHTFAAIWDGSQWCHIMPEVYTEENRRYYSREATNGENSPTAAFTNEEVLMLRQRYVKETAKEIHEDYKDRCSYKTLQQILWGRQYKDVPIYKKKKKEWINL